MNPSPSILHFHRLAEFLEAWLRDVTEQTGSSRGLKSSLARAMGVSPTMMTFFLQGSKTPNLEQASDLADFLKLTDFETDYLFVIIDFERAGTTKLRTKLKRKIQEMQNEAKKLSRRIRPDKELSDQVKAIYYSNWTFTAIRNLAAVPGHDSEDAIARYLGLPKGQVRKSIDFLLAHGLMARTAGRLTYGPQTIHVTADSPFVVRHHQNWRHHAIEKMNASREDDLFITCPMSLSKAVADEIRRGLPEYFQSIMQKTGPSPSEETYCFNLDWFKF